MASILMGLYISGAIKFWPYIAMALAVMALYSYGMRTVLSVLTEEAGLSSGMLLEFGPALAAHTCIHE